MAESKKRAADSDGANQVKKPKFEKKSAAPKNSADKAKGGNPFQNKGKRTFVTFLVLCIYFPSFF